MTRGVGDKADPLTHDPAGPSHLAPPLKPLLSNLESFLTARQAERAGEPLDPRHVVRAVLGASRVHVAARP